MVTPFLEKVIQRALAYLNSGFPVNFQGPSGTGKTSLALHLAHLLGRPVMLIHGDEDLDSTDMLGSLSGYKSRLLMDNFVHSVLKQEEKWEPIWVEGRLAIACQNGMTLIYDEFTRSHPETNNVLLSVLEEKILQLPGVRPGDTYLRVHPNFRAIFTSNPEEYAGVYKSQDALRDRMITIELGQMDMETEVKIASVRSGLDLAKTYQVVAIVRHLAAVFPSFKATLRRSIMLAKMVKDLEISLSSSLFQEICQDVLVSELTRKDSGHVQRSILQQKVAEVIARSLSYTQEGGRKWVHSSPLQREV